MSRAQIGDFFAPIYARLAVINDQCTGILQDVAALKLEALADYLAALDAFDWQHDFSEEGRVRESGREALADLHAMQQDVDPDGSMWRAHPGSQQHGSPRPILRGAV